MVDLPAPVSYMTSRPRASLGEVAVLPKGGVVERARMRWRRRQDTIRRDLQGWQPSWCHRAALGARLQDSRCGRCSCRTRPEVSPSSAGGLSLPPLNNPNALDSGQRTDRQHKDGACRKSRLHAGRRDRLKAARTDGRADGLSSRHLIVAATEFYMPFLSCPTSAGCVKLSHQLFLVFCFWVITCKV